MNLQVPVDRQCEDRYDTFMLMQVLHADTESTGYNLHIVSLSLHLFSPEPIDTRLQ